MRTEGHGFDILFGCFRLRFRFALASLLDSERRVSGRLPVGYVVFELFQVILRGFECQRVLFGGNCRQQRILFDVKLGRPDVGFRLGKA